MGCEDGTISLSANLECAFVTHSPESKMSCLDVTQDTINTFNLTSEEVAREMAEAALRISRTNLVVSTTRLAKFNAR